MKVLMLGWEYPPHINGGLGTACAGLTEALSRAGLGIDFVVPHLHGDEQAAHMRLFDSNFQESVPGFSFTGAFAGGGRVQAIPSLLSPYLRPKDYSALRQLVSEAKIGNQLPFPTAFTTSAYYCDDLIGEVYRFAELAMQNLYFQGSDIIHAHDWMTYPAGVVLREKTGCPLIVHVHSLEADRAGDGANTEIAKIEKEGCEAADRVIAVSEYTKRRICALYGVPEQKVTVIHNGINLAANRVHRQRNGERSGKKTILFLGRITFQKGPDYFIECAKELLRREEELEFQVAGIGDMLPWAVNRVRQEGLDDYFSFLGFVPHKFVPQVFANADVYVMPSVSEPFGLTALESIQAGTPVVLSKQTGVSEVLTHALKVDFWDVQKMAKLVLGVLRYPELSADLIHNSQREIEGINWDRAANRTIHVYNEIA